jgi:hypothetical protein
MRVLVTGASGHYGSFTVSEPIDAGRSGGSGTAPGGGCR